MSPKSSNIKSEHPLRPFLTWLKREIRQTPDGKEILLSFDKLYETVFRKARVSPVSSFTFFRRLSKNSNVSIKKCGEVTRKVGRNEYIFVPKRKANPASPAPVQSSMPSVGIGPIGVMFALKELTVGFNKMESKLGEVVAMLTAQGRTLGPKE